MIVFNMPTVFDNRMNAYLGFYVQDAWHVTNRLTDSQHVDPQQTWFTYRRRPRTGLQGRLMRVTAQIDF